MSLFKKAADLMTGGIVKDVADLADRFITTKQEKEEFLQAVRQREQEFRTQMQRFDMEDRANARQMQIEALRQGDSFSKRYSYYLATLIILAAIAFGVGLMFYEIPETNRRLVEMFADIFLFAGAITVIQFFFGSSKGSADKNQILRSPD